MRHVSAGAGIAQQTDDVCVEKGAEGKDLTPGDRQGGSLFRLVSGRASGGVSQRPVPADDSLTTPPVHHAKSSFSYLEVVVEGIRPHRDEISRYLSRSPSFQHPPAVPVRLFLAHDVEPLSPPQDPPAFLAVAPRRAPLLAAAICCAARGSHVSAAEKPGKGGSGGSARACTLFLLSLSRSDDVCKPFMCPNLSIHQHGPRPDRHVPQRGEARHRTPCSSSCSWSLTHYTGLLFSLMQHAGPLLLGFSVPLLPLALMACRT